MIVNASGPVQGAATFQVQGGGGPIPKGVRQRPSVTAIAARVDQVLAGQPVKPPRPITRSPLDRVWRHTETVVRRIPTLDLDELLRVCEAVASEHTRINTELMRRGVAEDPSREPTVSDKPSLASEHTAEPADASQ